MNAQGYIRTTYLIYSQHLDTGYMNFLICLWVIIFFSSDEGSAVDPGLVPSVPGTGGDPASLHLEHFSINRIFRGAEPAEGREIELKAKLTAMLILNKIDFFV